MPTHIHSRRLDALYRSYLVGQISDREFSRKVDELITDAAAVANSLGTVVPILR